MFETFGSTIPGRGMALALGLDVMLRATALLAIVFSIDRTLGRRDAAARSALWNACLLALSVLPISSLCLPRLALPILRSEHGTETTSPIPAPMTTSIPELQNIEEPAIAATSIAIPENVAAGRQTASEASPVPQFPIAADRSLSFSLEGLVLAAYLTGILLLITRLASSLLQVARLRRQSAPFDERLWKDSLAHWSNRLGIGRRVALRRSDQISIPVAIGWLSPTIIVPDRLIRSAGTSVVDAVLLHELGHIRRGDYGWNLVRKLVHCVYWPHPLVWLLGRIIGAVREQACDDLCIHHLGGSPAYRASLIDVASGLIRRPEPALGLAMARSTNLGQRLAWIDHSRGEPLCLLRRPTRFAVAAAIVAVAAAIGSVTLVEARPERSTQAEPSPAEAKSEPAEKPGAKSNEAPSAIEVTVIGKDTGKPLKNATVRAAIDLSETKVRTDDQGKLRIDLSRRLFCDALSLDVWAEGYVQQRHFFSQDDPSHPRIPAQVTFALHPGEETLGGTVVDEQQRPIAGVHVEIWGYLGEKKEPSELAYHVDTFTDGRGQWRCRSFRKMTFAYLYLSHPDYLADNQWHPRQHGQPGPSAPAKPGEGMLSALRDFSDVQIMTKGTAISGKVVDDEGRPVPGAEVGWLEAESNTFHHDVPTMTTGVDGEFRFPHVRPGRLAIQVKARGHAPALMSTEAKANAEAEPIVITLGPARSLAGRVVDWKGKPISDALVVVDTWRGYRSLGVYLKSDSEGRFRWDDAPSDSVLIDASRSGYNGVFRRPVSPDDKEIVLTLKRSLSIRGEVRDSETNGRIEEAQVDVGTVDSTTGTVHWRDDLSAFMSQGHLQAALDAENPTDYRLRVRARGYQPFETRTLRSDERSVTLEIKLTKAAVDSANILKGTVRRTDGQPLAGAEVMLTYPLRGGRSRLPSANIQDGKVQADQGQTIAKTDAAGQFSLAREPDPEGQYYAVIVVHPGYYAEVPRAAFEANREIMAKPWARIEGTIRINGRPAPREEVQYFAERLGNPGVPYLGDAGKATADARGHFVLEHVAPGDVRVARGFGDPSSQRGFRAWSNGTLVEARAGETVRADVGGNGRPLIARVALPEGFDPKADYTLHSEFEIVSDRPVIPYPKDVLANRGDAMVDWGKKWWPSAEGREYRRHWFRLGQAKLEPDGTIRADDVPPGDYVLRLTYSAQAIYGPGRGNQVVYATRRFTVPPIPGGSSFEPLDLGVLKTTSEAER